MRPFEYVRADDVAAAVALVSADPEADYLAGGTTELDLVLKDGVLEPERLVDITRLPLRGITRAEDTLRVGALVTMEELAADPTVSERVPFVREALLAGASPQLRNMATIGGNLLQRTRCRYFRDATVPACNKRTPGSGCAAVRGPARMHAILGASEHCIALHASDLCVPLVALDTVVDIQGVDGSRSVPLTQFYVLPGERPDIENVLQHGELITRDTNTAAAGRHAVRLPEGARPSLLRVRAHLRGRGAADRRRHDRARPPRSRRCRDDAVAGSRGRGDSPRRTRHRPNVPRRGAGRACVIRSRSRAPRSRSSSPSARSSESCTPYRESRHDDRHAREDHR